MLTPLRTDKPLYDRFRAVPIPYLLKNRVHWTGIDNYFHTKLYIIDDQWMFGSSNFDIISLKRNYELNVFGRSGPTLEKCEACIEHLKERASVASIRPEPLWMRMLFILFYRIAEFFFKLT